MISKQCVCGAYTEHGKKETGKIDFNARSVSEEVLAWAVSQEVRRKTDYTKLSPQNDSRIKIGSGESHFNVS